MRAWCSTCMRLPTRPTERLFPSHSVSRLAIAALAAVAAIVVFSGFNSTAAQPVATAPPGAAGCAPPSPATPWNETGFLEVRGTIRRHASLWTLFFLPEAASWADSERAVFAGAVDQEVKILWRMTGKGPLRLRAYGPNGEVLKPLWGPERHAGSNFVHPGSEWGAGFQLPAAGCWRLQATRTKLSGSVWIVLR